MRIRGFTLIEVIISLALSGLIFAAVMLAYSTFNKILKSRRLINDINSNMSIAINNMTRDISTARYGLGASVSDLTNWTRWVTGITNNPQIQQGSGGTADVLTVAAAFARVATLSAAASSNATMIAVQTGQGSYFDTTNRWAIYVGRTERARVDRVNGDTLIISTDPRAGYSAGLQYSYQSNDPVELIQVVTYSIVPASSSMPSYLSRDTHSTAVSDWSNNVVALGIEDLQLTTGVSSVTFTLRGRSLEEDYSYTDPIYKDAYRRVTITNTVYLRN